MQNVYDIKEKIDKKAQKELDNYDSLTAQLLYNRGIKTKKEAEKFLNPDFEAHLHDPFLLPDMKKAVKRILEAIENNEKIGVWSDYDADGIPGGALLYDFFKLIGFENFENYIPDRHSEGYGLNKKGIDELKENGVKLLITVDCGIRENENIDYANSLGIETIITDHHEAGSELPKALAIVNPKRLDSKYPEKVLCGAGVVWKLIQGILKIEKLNNKEIKIKEGQEKWLLDLVGIATLSDMVPLVGENKVLSHYGLKVLRRGKRIGLRKIFREMKINLEHISEDDIGFMLTPRINAASRMGHPRDAFSLLTAKTEEEAEIFVKHLDKINNERKGIVASITKEAKKIVKEKILNFGEKPVIVLGNPEWRPSLLGLAANSIAEEYQRPVFMWGRPPSTEASEGKEGGDILKGSCRSDGKTDLVAIMERSREIFLEFGGHKFSGGFSVSYEKIHLLEEILIDASTHTVSEKEKVLVDGELTLSDVNEELISKIEKLGPFGVGNEKPIFIFKNIIPEKIQRFGKAKEHLSIIFRDGSKTKKAILFFTSPDQFGDLLKEGIKTNLVANIEKSFWNGSSEIRLRIVDFF